MYWTTESVRAENEYKREQLRRLASHRDLPRARSVAWWRRLRENPRHRTESSRPQHGQQQLA